MKIPECSTTHVSLLVSTRCLYQWNEMVHHINSIPLVCSRPVHFCCDQCNFTMIDMGVQICSNDGLVAISTIYGWCVALVIRNAWSVGARRSPIRMGSSRRTRTGSLSLKILPICCSVVSALVISNASSLNRNTRSCTVVSRWSWWGQQLCLLLIFFVFWIMTRALLHECWYCGRRGAVPV